MTEQRPWQGSPWVPPASLAKTILMAYFLVRRYGPGGLVGASHQRNVERLAEAAGFDFDRLQKEGPYAYEERTEEQEERPS